MGNPKARAFKREQGVAEAWDRIRTQPREISEPTRLPGTGSMRAQVVYAPSFADRYAWDIRAMEDNWHLYRSDVIFEDLRYKLRAYDEIAVEPTILRDFLNRLYALSLPIHPDLRDLAGLDGTHFEIALEGGLSSAIRFQWWSKGPAHWHELTTLASEMIDAFSPLPLLRPPPLPR